jgi:cytochrome c556
MSRMNLRYLAAGLAAVLSAGYALTAGAQVRPQVLVEQRHSAMVLQGKYLYSLLPMASDKIPYNANIVARNAAYLEVLTQMAWDGFDPATAGEKNTRALPEIYSDPAAFKAAEEKLHVEVARFSATVKTGNEQEIKTGMVELNKVCNGCHDKFRARR